MHNADKHGTVEGREEAKRQRKNFMFTFPLTCLRIGIFISSSVYRRRRSKQTGSYHASSERVDQSYGPWASLVARWLRIRLPMQGTRVRALDREDPTCRGATKPVRHDY